MIKTIKNWLIGLFISHRLEDLINRLEIVVSKLENASDLSDVVTSLKASIKDVSEMAEKAVED